MGETVDNVRLAPLTEVVWCDHLIVNKNVVVRSNMPNLYFQDQRMYLVAEEGKVKLICPDCFIKAFISYGRIC